MFELDGQSLTLQDLEFAASRKNMDFDSFLEEMKTKGLVEKTSESSAAPDILIDRIAKIESGEVKPEEDKDELEVLKTIPSYYNKDRITPDSNVGYFPDESVHDPSIQPADQVTNQVASFYTTQENE